MVTKTPQKLTTASNKTTPKSSSAQKKRTTNTPSSQLKKGQQNESQQPKKVTQQQTPSHNSNKKTQNTPSKTLSAKKSAKHTPAQKQQKSKPVIDAVEQKQQQPEEEDVMTLDVREEMDYNEEISSSASPKQQQQHNLKRKLNEINQDEEETKSTIVDEQAEDDSINMISQSRSYMRFFDINSFYQPYAIRRMAFNRDETLLAVARMSSEIEIWKTPKHCSIQRDSSTRSLRAMNNEWTLLKKISAKKNTSIESIGWMRPKKGAKDQSDRLFTAGLHGVVTEWDLNTLLPKRMSGAYGGAIWSMAIHEQTIAIACEDGLVRLYNSDLLLKQHLGPSKSETIPNNNKLKHCEGNRLLAVCFNHDGTRMFCGGLTGAYCFDLKSGSLAYKIPLQASICTALCYLKDETLIVGDSSGQTLFCDAKFGTVLSSHKEHLADVLQIVPTSCQTKVLVTGIHPRVSMFQKGSNANQWVHTRGKYPHNHDLYAIAIYDDAHVFAGGLDGRLSFVELSDFFAREETTSRHFGLIPASDLSVARNISIAAKNSETKSEQRLLFVSDNRNVISVVQLPDKVPVVSEEPVLKKPKYDSDLVLNDQVLSNGLISQLLAVSKGGWTMSSFAVSPDGKTVCCCGPDFSAIFRLEFTVDEDNNVNIKVTERFDMKNLNVTPGLHCAFVNNQIVAVASRTNETLQLFNVEQKKLVYFYDLKSLNDQTSAISTQSLYFPTSVHSLCANEKYIVVARGQSIFVFDVQNHESTKPVWSMSLVSESDTVVYKVAFLDETSFYMLSSHNKLGIYDITEKKVVQDMTVGRTGEDMRGGVRGLVKGQSSIHAYTNYSLFNMHDSSYERKHRPRIDEMMIMNVLSLTNDEYAMIRFDYKSFYLTLLGVVYRKRYGT